MNLKKYVFNWEKYNFQPIRNFAQTTVFLTLGKAQLILLALYLQMLTIQITQTDSYKYRKSAAIKKVHTFKKWV